MAPLASNEDVAAQLGRPLTAAEETQVADILIKASALFRKASGQDFEAGTSTVRLQSQGGRVRLEQAPATEVTAVLDDEGVDVDHVLVGQWLTVTRNGCRLASHEYVTVTYKHGGDVPDEVRIAVAEVAAQTLRVTPAAAAGIVTQQRSAGGYQETNTFAAWALGGGTKLPPDTQSLAESFRYKGTRVVVCQP